MTAKRHVAEIHPRARILSKAHQKPPDPTLKSQVDLSEPV